MGFIANPAADKALMRMAAEKFKVLPNSNLESEQNKTIVKYIYSNDLAEPEWFAEQEQEMRKRKGCLSQ